MKNILISSFDMEIGGVERSLISMLENFDYNSNNVDLMLYSHSGELINLVPKEPKLLPELKVYKSFRMSIDEIIKSKMYMIAFGRCIAKLKAYYISNVLHKDSTCIQMQYMWKYSLPFLPKINKKYDIAISYLWPHYFVANKVNAKTKIAWIHTDYSKLVTDVDLDIKMWKKFDHIVAVSKECKKAFLDKYNLPEDKITVVENIASPNFVKKLAEESIEEIIKNDTRFKLITVARFSYAKGIDNAIKAMKVLKDKGYDNIVWYVVGYGSDEKILNNLIKEYGLEDRFILLGKRVNPFPYIQTADLYVQPSRYEGKAVTVTEAQILKKPVLITNYPTAKSQVRENIDGIITELSVDGIVNGIEKIINNDKLRANLIKNTSEYDYGNSNELNKLYALLK